MLTDLSLYLTVTQNAGILPTAKNLTDTAPAGDTRVTTLTGEATGYGELRADGSASAWSAGASLPDPSGHGFVWDQTTLEGESFPVGLWRPVVKLTTTAGSVTCDVYVRLFKLTAGGAYEPIAAAAALAVVLAAGVTQVVTPTAVEGSSMSFGVGERLYLDVILDITANTSSDPTATTDCWQNGGANESIQTPGYDTTPSAAGWTVLTLCTAAARKLGVLYTGQLLNASDGVILLECLNAMIDRWNAERSALYTVQRKQYDLTANKGTYTIGTGAGDWNDPRPILIQEANLLIAGLVQPLKLLTQPEWAALRETGNTAILASGLYCDYNWPVSTLRLNPIPKCASATQLELWSWQPIPLFASLSDPVDLPPAYYSALVANLAVKVAPEFEREPSGALVSDANDSKAGLSQVNMTQIPGALQAMVQAQAMQQAKQ
jgi:hypothetical protein